MKQLLFWLLGGKIILNIYIHLENEIEEFPKEINLTPNFLVYFGCSKGKIYIFLL